MADKTTEGVVAEPEEVEALLHNLCGYHLAERDPVFRYTVLTREQVLYDGLVAAIRRERGRALAEIVGKGQSMTQVAATTNLRTRQRVQRLIAIAKAADEAVAQVQAASRDFEEKLAAVEATLDEVLSGTAVTGPRNPSVVDSARPDADGSGVDEPPVDPRGVLEPTQALPALAAVLNPTRELSSETVPWWRRGRDSGAA
jgi:hypothetical protein